MLTSIVFIIILDYLGHPKTFPPMAYDIKYDLQNMLTVLQKLLHYIATCILHVYLYLYRYKPIKHPNCMRHTMHRLHIDMKSLASSDEQWPEGGRQQMIQTNC